jgi:hypothetical protein
MVGAMFIRAENAVDLDLLRQIARDGGLETQQGGRFPSGAIALMREGFIKEVAVGVGGYVCWKVTQRGLEQIA